MYDYKCIPIDTQSFFMRNVYLNYLAFEVNFDTNVLPYLVNPLLL